MPLTTDAMLSFAVGIVHVDFFKDDRGHQLNCNIDHALGNLKSACASLQMMSPSLCEGAPQRHKTREEWKALIPVELYPEWV